MFTRPALHNTKCRAGYRINIRNHKATNIPLMINCSFGLCYAFYPLISYVGPMLVHTQLLTTVIPICCRPNAFSVLVIIINDSAYDYYFVVS